MYMCNLNWINNLEVNLNSTYTNVSGNPFLERLTMDIWNLHTTSPTTLLLWRTGDNQFRVVQQGLALTLLINRNYILLDKKYKTILDKLTGQVTYGPVTIVDQVRQLRFDNFLELKVLNEIQQGVIDTANNEGLKIWRYSDEYVFVSTHLKDEIQKVTADELEFTFGFSNFAGTATGSR
jgi:hypothetical protein